VLAEIAAMLAEVTGGGATWANQVTAASRLDGDLHLDSLELAAFADRLRAAYGAVDLAAFISGMDIDQIIALTVGDVAAHVAAVRAK
jgi:acyl carrier protein